MRKKKPTTKPTKFIAVDGSCTQGNPGLIEWRGVLVDGDKKVEIFREAGVLGTNNIAEFIAIGKGIAWKFRNEIKWPIYSDSQTAIAWFRKQKCGTKYIGLSATQELVKETVNVIEAIPAVVNKWHTKQWGENPADFGRK